MAPSSSIVHAGGASLAMALALAPMAMAATPFDLLVGAWSGPGQIRYQDGQSDSMRCTAYYSEGGKGCGSRFDARTAAMKSKSVANYVSVEKI